MNDNAYRKVIDRLQPGADFEARTVRLLERHLETPAERKVPAPRKKLKAAGYAAAALAAAIAVLLILPNIAPARWARVGSEDAVIPAQPGANVTISKDLRNGNPAVPVAQTAADVSAGAIPLPNPSS